MNSSPRTRAVAGSGVRLRDFLPVVSDRDRSFLLLWRRPDLTGSPATYLLATCAAVGPHAMRSNRARARACASVTIDFPRSLNAAMSGRSPPGRLTSRQNVL